LDGSEIGKIGDRRLVSAFRADDGRPRFPARVKIRDARRSARKGDAAAAREIRFSFSSMEGRRGGKMAPPAARVSEICNFNSK
jgi:hypothetical protein